MSRNDKNDTHTKLDNAQVVHTESGDVYRVRKRKTKKPNKKLPYIVLAVLLVFVGAGAAFGLYLLSISSNLKYEGDATESLTARENKQKPFYVLAIGSDRREEEEGYVGRSDIMALIRVDLNKPQITVVSVPRDTPYELDGKKVKLNEVFHQYGDAACVKAVSEITGVPISHFVRIEFSQLKEVVDSMDGIMVDVPYDFSFDGTQISAGTQHLNGEQALAFTRARESYAGVSDISQDGLRQANVRAVLIALIKNVIQSPKAEIPGMVKRLSTMVKTDVPLSELTTWATKAAQAESLPIYSVTGPFDGDIDPETGLWLAYEQPEQWAALMKVVDMGGDPTEIAKQIQEGVYTDENVAMNTKTDGKE